MPTIENITENNREAIFKVGDKVKGSLIENGEVWKISYYGIHVRQETTEDERKMVGNSGKYRYQVFHFHPTHHSQTHINKLSKL